MVFYPLTFSPNAKFCELLKSRAGICTEKRQAMTVALLRVLYCMHAHLN